MTGTIETFPGVRAEKCPFDPPPAIQSLQREAPLTRVRLRNGTEAWLVTRYAEQKALLADARLSSDATRPGYPIEVDVSAGGGTPISFILMDDPEHARLRRMVTSSFTIKRIETMRPGVQQIVDDLLDDLLAGPKPVDLVQAFALPVPSLVICRLLGVPYDDHESFQRTARSSSTGTPPGTSGAPRAAGSSSTWTASSARRSRTPATTCCPAWSSGSGRAS